MEAAMENMISADDLASRLSDILNRVHKHGERFVVERDGERVATLAPVEGRLPITLKEAATQLKDITIPGEGFADDLEVIQSSQPLAELPEWLS
jgi:antitoxin (DNA-binding transcriptional repressor) of toxin-antitoxin stability system